MNPVKALENHGQAIWLDFLARGFVAKGDLKALIETDGVKGVTSNPSIFEKAIGSSDEYDGAIGHALKAGDRPVADLFEALAIEDIQNAADVLRPVYDRLNGEDGFVSLEVALGDETAGEEVQPDRLAMVFECFDGIHGACSVRSVFWVSGSFRGQGWKVNIWLGMPPNGRGRSATITPLAPVRSRKWPLAGLGTPGRSDRLSE